MTLDFEVINIWSLQILLNRLIDYLNRKNKW